MINYIALDTETGGLDPFRNPLLQVGCYAPNGDSLNIRIIPPVHLTITEQAKKVNGWPESHKGYPVYDESAAIDQLKGFLDRNKPQWILCHNAVFDIPFIKEAISRTNKNVYIPRALCTMSFVKALEYVGGYNGVKYSLDALIKEFVPDFARSGTHDASEDARATHLVFQGMLSRFDAMAKLANNIAFDRLKEIEQNSNGVVQTTESKPIKSFRQGSRWGRSGR